MNSIEKEIKNLEKIGQIAYDLIAQGEFRRANQQLKKLKKTFCVSEAEQIRIPLEAFALQLKGQRAEARELIKWGIGYLWNSADAFAVFRNDNPKVTPASKVLQIEILGGNLAVGAFTQFTSTHVTTVEVIAEDETEALKFIDELLNFTAPKERRVLSCTTIEAETPLDEHKGVSWLLPVRQMKH